MKTHNEQECDFDGCADPATTTVRTVLGPKPFCANHGAYVRGIEREWDEAERDYYDQGGLA